MKGFKELYKSDLMRYDSIDCYAKKYLYYYRRVSTVSGKIAALYYRFRFRLLSEKHGMEIPRTVVFGKGLYIGHPYNITVNGDVKFGNNINIHKGVTIGQENRGSRTGVPSIGNRVWFGINSTVVGKVVIGDDVLIAPNSYVNCDVPSHSVVLGNPCKIIPKENATEGYINNSVQS